MKRNIFIYRIFALHYSASKMNFLHCFYVLGIAFSPYLMSWVLKVDNNWRKGYLLIAVIQSVISAVATAEKMKEFRLVVWGMHGIYGAGKTMDETFGLIETVEKAAQIYMLTAHLPRVNTIRDDQMVELAEHFGVDYRKVFLNL